MADWLGTNYTPLNQRKHRSFKEARKFARTLELRNQDDHEWRQYCKSGKKPMGIPAGPSRTYKKEWKSWGDWLGTGNIADQLREYRSSDKLIEYSKSEEKPKSYSNLSCIDRHY